jgi:acetyl/propionyl-CoA carboxylase alpha subunit
MSGINPAHKFLALIKEAEDFVANEKKLEAIQEAARVAAELKVKQEAEAKAAAELKTRQEADAKAAADQLAVEKLAASKAASLKKTTITCVKGKLTKKVTATNPKCPTGYKKK